MEGSEGRGVNRYTAISREDPGAAACQGGDDKSIMGQAVLCWVSLISALVECWFRGTVSSRDHKRSSFKVHMLEKALVSTGCGKLQAVFPEPRDGFTSLLHHGRAAQP